MDGEHGEHGASRTRRIPEATVVRLPVYQRILASLLQVGTTTVSSELLAERAGVNAAKVRKDFSLFGSFGTRGTGYDAAYLAAQIERALGADRDWPIVIVGLGNLGRALANSEGFRSHGFRVAALYDVDAAVVGTTVARRVIRHLDDLAAATTTEVPVGPGEPASPRSPSAPASPRVPAAPIGVITTPAAVAQSVADLLVTAGVDAILNFAPTVLVVPPPILVRNVDLSIELQAMSFFLGRRTAAPSSNADLRTGAGAS